MRRPRGKSPVNGECVGSLTDPNLYQMTRAHVDSTGKQWAAGTQYYLDSAGIDDARRKYQRVKIGTHIVTFYDA